MRANWANRTHVAKVAAVAALLVMGCYIIGVVILNLTVVHRLTTEVDARLSERLVDAYRLTLPAPATAGSRADSALAHPGEEIDDAPSFVWRVAPRGVATALTSGAPLLPRRTWSTVPTTIGAEPPFRYRAVKVGSDWLVAGQSIAEIQRVQNVLGLPELSFGIALLVAVFAGALAIGLRALAPLELVRRRQAEFTADASHELRTPLSVIEAEVDLALSRRRDAATYQAVLHRVAGEGRRLRRIVDDLLWLARADSELTGTQIGDASDLAAITASCTDRFQAVAQTRGVALNFRDMGDGPLVVSAQREWIDRLIGVLVDNACKYAGTGGRVEVRVGAAGNRVSLQVDDSGPGIPADQRSLIFDRFHRATESQGGTGLGLAIADSVVRATQGTWWVGVAPLGGARLAVSWRRATIRGPSASEERSSDERPGGTSATAQAGLDRAGSLKGAS